jgi:hypothetical protein
MRRSALYAKVEEAAKDSAEALAECLRGLIESGEDPDADRNDPIEVQVPRLLTRPELKPFNACISSALALGARTWSFDRPTSRPAFVASQLFRAFATPQVAVAVATRMLAPGGNPAGLLGDGAYNDQFIDAVLQAGFEPTVRNRIVDLANSAAFERSRIAIFYRVVYLDIASVPLIIDRVLDTAEALVSTGNQPLLHLVGFDSLITLSDIEGILGQLDESQAERFVANFLALSRRYVVVPGGLPSLRGVAEPETSAAVYDTVEGNERTVSHPGALVRGAIDAVSAAQDACLADLFEQGLQAKALVPEL